MRLATSVLPYLRGERHADALEVGLEFDAEDYVLRSRLDVLPSLCAARRVLHVGCVEHGGEQAERKLRAGTWMHQRLCERAARCRGVDIDAAGIAYLRDVLGYADVEALDLATETSEAIDSEIWDSIVLGEVLEHIEDPVAFLRRLRPRFAVNVGALIVTVPNAFNRKNLGRMRRGVEVINSDHLYWFTPYTLSKVLQRAGFAVERMQMLMLGSGRGRSRWRRRFDARHPLARSTILAVARPEPSEGGAGPRSSGSSLLREGRRAG